MRFPFFAASLLFGLAFSSSAHAGIYGDDMTRCLVAKTSTQDKTDLVRWIFVIAALHPDVKSIATVPEDQRTEANRAAGKLLERLLTDSCKSQVKEAIKYEGAGALQASFQVLGQVAMQELMTNPEVRNGFRDIAKYVDESKFKELAPAGK